MTIRSRFASIAVVFGLSAFAFGCNVKKGEIEDSIKKTMKEKNVTMKSVSCPGDMKAKVGSTYECSGETDDGEKVTFKVEATDFTGGAKWELNGKIYDGSDVEDEVATAIGEKANGKKVKVKCKAKMFVFNKGDKFNCDLDVDGEKDVVVIEPTDDNGGYKWKVKSKSDKGDDDDDKKDDKKKKKGDDDDDDKKKDDKKKKKGDDDDD
jgi:hypothetical protein